MLRPSSLLAIAAPNSTHSRACRIKKRDIPEVGPQVHDLPRPEADEQPRGADAEVLDPAVGALVGIAQLLLAQPQVLHLRHDLGDGLLDAAQLGLDGLELLRGLDGGPVLGVGADVDVELHVAAEGLVVVGWKRWRVSCLCLKTGRESSRQGIAGECEGLEGFEGFPYRS